MASTANASVVDGRGDDVREAHGSGSSAIPGRELSDTGHSTLPGVTGRNGTRLDCRYRTRVGSCEGTAPRSREGAIQRQHTFRRVAGRDYGKAEDSRDRD